LRIQQSAHGVLISTFDKRFDFLVC
jgi:hypothetical protein